MSCNAGVGDRNNLSKGHYSTKVLAPTGGGSTSISLGGGYGNAPKRPQQNRGVRRNPGVNPQSVSNISLGGTQAPVRTKTGVRRAPQQNKGAAGGKAALSNAGGYGNLDIHSKPSSRVLSQPGGGSSNIFGGPTQSKPKRTGGQMGGGMGQQRGGMGQQRGGMGGGGMGQQRGGMGGGGMGQQRGGMGQQRGGMGQQRGGQQRGGQSRAAGGKAALSNTGGYGNLDIHSKPSSRVLNQPGGGSSDIFGSGGKKGSAKKLNASQQRAKASLQSNVFGGPTQPGGKKSSSKKVTHQPGGGQSRGQQARKGVKVGHQPGGGQTSMGNQQSSTRRMQPSGGSSSVQLSGGGRGNMKSSTKVLAPTGGSSQGIFAPQGRGQARKPQARGGGGNNNIFGGGPSQNRGQPKTRGPRPMPKGAAGGGGALRNAGGYGNLDIHSKPSTRVHAPPGGKSNIPF